MSTIERISGAVLCRTAVGGSRAGRSNQRSAVSGRACRCRASTSLTLW